MINAVFLSFCILLSRIHLIASTVYTCNSSSPCGCSTSTVVTTRIVGGEAALNSAWGWMVSLQQSSQHICGASLLTSEYAVTAAHCVDDVTDDVSILSILAGTNDLNDLLNPATQRRTIVKIIIHPYYDPYFVTNDVAILQFSPLVLSASSTISFICLPTPNQDPFQVNTDLVAIGWGTTAENSTTVSNSLQQVTVQVIASNSTDCIQGEIVNANVQFCAGISTGGKDTCQGDSGGPIMAYVNQSWILAGTTSAGVGCARRGYPGIYTRISAFVPFIRSHLDVSSNDRSINQSSVTEKSILIIILGILVLFYHC